MMKMNKKLTAVSILLTAAACVFAADATGKWTYTAQGRDGESRNMTITLRQEGNKLVGTVPALGRGGAAGGPADISNGKIDGEKIFFEVVRQFVGLKFLTRYEGTLAGDEMKLKVTTQAPGGEQVRNIVAKRSK